MAPSYCPGCGVAGDTSGHLDGCLAYEAGERQWVAEHGGTPAYMLRNRNAVHPRIPASPLCDGSGWHYFEGGERAACAGCQNCGGTLAAPRIGTYTAPYRPDTAHHKLMDEARRDS